MGKLGQTDFAPNWSANMGRQVGVLASGKPRYKVGALAIDWNTEIPVPTDVVIQQEGRTIKLGQKYYRYGTVLCQITTALTGLLAGGVAGTVNYFGRYTPAVTTTMNQGATLAVGSSGMTLTDASLVFPGDYVSLDTAGNLEKIQIGTVAGNAVTFAGAAVTTISHADGVAVVKLDDGRQSIVRGRAFISDHTINNSDLGSVFAGQCFDSVPDGFVYLARIARDFDTAGGVPSNPTRATLESGFPGIDWVLD